jgi:uncharacterized protein (DUF2164 family)
VKELAKEVRAQAIASLRRYVAENLPEPIGELPAGLLLQFFVTEVGPLIYNQAIDDAQARMHQRVADLPGELFEEPFQYWAKPGGTRRG